MKATTEKRTRNGLHPNALVFALTCIMITSCSSPDSVGPPNRPPVVKSLSANPVVLAAGETSVVTVVATDPEGNRLSYEWAADLGYLTGQGTEVFYAAPLCCASWATVRVTVSDGNGGVAHETISLTIERGP